ncbi:MAG: glycosyltransferase [Candidatus Thorarchaeota archaeon]
MKIGVITAGNLPSQWAHSINTVKHANGFYNLNNRVEILAIQNLSDLKRRVGIRDIHDFYDIDRKVKIHFFNENFFKFFQEYKFLNYPLSHISEKLSFLQIFENPEDKISKYCSKNKFNLVYSRSYKGAFACIKNKIPTILETHTTLVNNPHLKRVIKVSDDKYFKGIVTIHKLLAENFFKNGVPNEKMLILEDAVDIEKFNNIKANKEKLRRYLKLPLDKNIITYCGSLNPGKGIKMLIRVSKKFNQNTLFYIIGGEKKWLNYWRNKVKLEKITNVKFIGFVLNKLVPLYLKSSDVLIMLYDLEEKNAIMDINTTSPIKLFEYMAAKRPIVTIKLPTIEKIVRHNQEALLSEWDNVEEIAENIQKLLNNHLLVNQISQNAYKKAKNHTYIKRCKRILEKFGS